MGRDAERGRRMDKRELLLEFTDMTLRAMQRLPQSGIDLDTLNGFRENLRFILEFEKLVRKERPAETYARGLPS